MANFPPSTFHVNGDPFPTDPFPSPTGFDDSCGLISLKRDGQCVLSVRGRALNSVLTALAGSIYTGVNNGPHVAFVAAWISFFASVRIIVVAIYYVGTALRLEPIEGGVDFVTFWAGPRISTKNQEWEEQQLQRPGTNFFVVRPSDAEPNLFGWIGWTYGAVFSPLSSLLWTVVNWEDAPGQMKLVRGLAIAVNTLPLTIDTCARYGAQLEQLWGSPWRWVFSFITAAGCLTQGVLSVLLQVEGTQELLPGVIFFVVLVIVLIFSIVWAFGSFALLRPNNKATKLQGWVFILLGLGMGLFGGLFTAFLAFAVIQFASFCEGTEKQAHGLGLGQYLKCDSASWLEKLTAILP